MQVFGAEVTISDENARRFTITSTAESGDRTMYLESNSEAATLDWAFSIQKIATRSLEVGNKNRNSWGQNS